jgi:chromosome segregation ATPase
MDLSIAIPVAVTLGLALIGGYRWLIKLGEQSKSHASEISELKEDIKELKAQYEDKNSTLQELYTAVEVIKSRLASLESQSAATFKAINALNDKLDRDFVRKEYK